jgi:protein-S-isoprenylcysteine O-methyltransferase Ste14
MPVITTPGWPLALMGLTIIRGVQRPTATASLAGAVFAWTGAAMFAGSLAYFLFSYATTFGIPAAGGPIAPALTWNVALFTIFALHHSLLARNRARQLLARWVAPRLERASYVWVASVLFIVVCARWEPVPGVAWRVEGAAVWLLRLIQAAAVWLTLRSAAVLDILELAGLRQLNGRAERPADERTRSAQFKTSGPYGWVRHPIYSAWFLLVFTASPMTMTRLTFAVVSCAYLLAAIPFEERSMRALPGGGYDRYRAQVRWKLVPGIY